MGSYDVLTLFTKWKYRLIKEKMSKYFPEKKKKKKKKNVLCYIGYLASVD